MNLLDCLTYYKQIHLFLSVSSVRWSGDRRCTLSLHALGVSKLHSLHSNDLLMDLIESLMFLHVIINIVFTWKLIRCCVCFWQQMKASFIFNILGLCLAIIMICLMCLVIINGPNQYYLRHQVNNNAQWPSCIQNSVDHSISERDC